MSNPINIKFGKKVKEVRQKRRMTQEELAESIKTSYKYIQRIEGKTPPDIRLTTIERIASALKVTSSKLLET
ncbi:MAG: helix-turn-helix transcriptional regulator [Candidatus Omnitrophica bacterium]|nr:helix-turn-helix transcriptional regulator [Candidatus Omnitrophota bacterium]